MERINPVVRFNNVCKSYNKIQVLRNLSFDVHEKEVVGIFGPSGSGKTTILKLTAGLTAPSTGSVVMRSSLLGYVFQEPRVLPWKTALDNVVIPLLARGLDHNLAKKKAGDWLVKMGLEEFDSYFPAQLSGGMVQRISLARAFAVEPDVLLLDEPFGALDIQLKETMFSLLEQQLDAQPVTVLYVSHVPEDVIRFATRLFVLSSNGELKELPVMNHQEMTKFLKNEDALKIVE